MHADRTTTSILQLLNSLSANVKIYFQWVPSHVNVCENDIAGGLAREGSHEDSMHGGCLTFSEIAKRVKQDASSSWKQTPYMSSMKETILVLLCLGQAIDEMKLLSLCFAEDILELNGMWRVLKITLLVRMQCDPSRSARILACID
ncbi:uncharacterized protein TNCV_5116831 [Trichonephila clavipes]|nr:uncharacterized protein TNCV_5116831 [Trichonephila clavipes]